MALSLLGLIKMGTCERLCDAIEAMHRKLYPCNLTWQVRFCLNQYYNRKNIHIDE